MHIVLGATGHIGKHLTETLLKAGEPVIAAVHSREKAEALQDKGVQTQVVDVLDTQALRSLFRRGKRAFLLNPPAAPTEDTNKKELATARSIASALDGSGLEKVVLASTYGARPGNAIGDLSVLYELEGLVKATGIPAAINRGAYYFTNLDMLLEPARQGILPTAFPADLLLPMVAPADLAARAAKRLLSGQNDVGIQYVEGPARYTFQDVANAFSAALGRSVKVETTPRAELEGSFRQLGFSAEAARSYAAMTAATLDGPELPPEPVRGSSSLSDYVRALAS